MKRLGLDQAINERLDLLKVHLPYHESDHVLNIAYNLLAGNTRLEHLELLRTDEAYLDALGASRIPDPTTAGDFCRRAGFRKVRLRGDTDFSQTEHLDRWHAEGVQFVFGMPAMRNLYEHAENLPRNAWKELVRPASTR